MKHTQYKLHMAYGKHIGRRLQLFSTPENDPRESFPLYYCADCEGFYVVSGAQQLAVAPALHCCPGELSGGAMYRKWKEFLESIGGTCVSDPTES